MCYSTIRHYRAKWMAMKIFMFKKTIQKLSKEAKQLEEICNFGILLHIKYWFSASKAAIDLPNDLFFIKKFYNNKTVNKIIKNALLNKFTKYLWHLSKKKK